jgi:hypothetical protein
MAITQPDALCLSSSSVVLMVVPMFHANSWGLNFGGKNGSGFGYVLVGYGLWFRV